MGKIMKDEYKNYMAKWVKCLKQRLTYYKYLAKRYAHCKGFVARIQKRIDINSELVDWIEESTQAMTGITASEAEKDARMKRQMKKQIEDEKKKRMQRKKTKKKIRPKKKSSKKSRKTRKPLKKAS